MTCGSLPFHIESLKKPTNYDVVLKYPVSVSIRKLLSIYMYYKLKIAIELACFGLRII